MEHLAHILLPKYVGVSRKDPIDNETFILAISLLDPYLCSGGLCACKLNYPANPGGATSISNQSSGKKYIHSDLYDDTCDY